MRVGVSIALFALLVHVSLACTCLLSTFKESYDRAETVVIAKVVARAVQPTPKPAACLTSKPPCLLPQIFYNFVRYKFKLVRVFKGCGPSSTTFFGDTTDNSASCGISFKIGDLYMLNLGKELPTNDGVKTFFVNICQGNLAVKSLTREQIGELKKCYKLPQNQCKAHDVLHHDVSSL
eukprot:gb/GEZJ01006161.1/.p1 GENE.gb/GEZJ01006161.1/~~gb/GEZJ01006161.1/.p1  ORF type:complete len:178 (-),score=11.23 gb/GEZJ01006161.1/:246-779(-)